MTRPALIACSHGTASEDGRQAIKGLIGHVRAILPDVRVEEAFVDVQTPEAGAGADIVTAPLAPNLRIAAVVAERYTTACAELAATV